MRKDRNQRREVSPYNPQSSGYHNDYSRDRPIEANKGHQRPSNSTLQDTHDGNASSNILNLTTIERKYKELVEDIIPSNLSSVLRHPILYTEIINSAFTIINDYLDNRIKSLIVELGKTLGIPEQKDILLQIVLNYPNYLSSLNNDDLTEMNYLLRECLQDILLKRRSSLK